MNNFGVSISYIVFNIYVEKETPSNAEKKDDASGDGGGDTNPGK